MSLREFYTDEEYESLDLYNKLMVDSEKPPRLYTQGLPYVYTNAHSRQMKKEVAGASTNAILHAVKIEQCPFHAMRHCVTFAVTYPSNRQETFHYRVTRHTDKRRKLEIVPLWRECKDCPYYKY